MKITDEKIETALRGAPKPKTPANLKARLISGIQLSKSRAVPGQSGNAPRSWIARWWPALVPAALSAACAALIAMQQMEIRDLKSTLATLPAVSETTPATVNSTAPAPAVVQSGAPNENGELARLRADAEALRNDVAQLEQLQTENSQLRARLQAASSGLSADETAMLQTARDRSMAIACVNNLKQFGLAVRIWANDHNEKFPPNIVCMSNELSTPKILVCPADTNRVVAPNFFSFTAANCSYEYFGADANEAEPTRVLSRCPVHGNIGLADGSVQMKVAKDHPEKLVQRDGKLYFLP